MASYPAVIELRVDGITQVTRVLDTITKLDNALVSIKKTPLAIDSKNATDGIRVLKKEVDDFIFKLGKGTGQLAATTAGINAQAAAFRNLAANAKIGGTAFNLYTQAAEQARQKSSIKGGLAEIAAISNLYKIGKTAPTQAFKGVDELIKFGANVPKNTASLELYRTELLRVLDVVEYGTSDYRNLERAIAGVNKQMQIGQGIGPKQGPLAALETAGPQTGSRRLGGIAKRLPGALSGGIVGGAFPLLFGQSGGAALGGLLGGVAGGLLPVPGGSFAGGLLGTLLGDIANQGQKIKQLGEDIGFSAQQTNALGDAFKKANTDVEKFTAVIQNIRGLGLELEDQAELIRLTTTLTEKYGGEFTKVGTTITSALESGKVNQSTLNQLTSQGINVQQALADKFGVSRDRLLEMAKKGQISVQDLVDTLVDLGNKGAQAVQKPASGFDLLGKATRDLGTALGSLGGVITKALAPPLNWLADKLAGIIALAAQGIQSMAMLLSGGTAQTAAANAKARQRLAAEGGPSVGTRYLTQAQQKRLDVLQAQEQAKILKPKPLQKIDVTGLGQTASSKGGGDSENKAKRLAEQVQKQLEAATRLAVESEFELANQAAITDLEKIQNDYDRARLERMTKFETLYKNALSDAERAYLVSAQRSQIEQANLVLEQQKSEYHKKEIADLYALLDVSELLNEVNQRRFGRAFGMQGGQFRTDINLDPNNKGVKQLDLYNEELKLLSDRLTLAKDGAEAIGSAFSTSFQGIISGTQTTQQALQQFFLQVGQAFNEMAAQIIAKMITMYIFKSVLGIFGGGGGDIFGGKTANLGNAAFNGGTSGFNPATFAGTSFMADGGFVTGPTSAVVGEAGSEYVIPASKMRGAMNRYAAGARGSAVIPAGSEGGDGMTATMAAPSAIDVRYTVERINQVDYVTADQFQRGMQQAASQGAAQGEQRTLRRLQSSNSTRKRLGI